MQHDAPIKYSMKDNDVALCNVDFTTEGKRKPPSKQTDKIRDDLLAIEL